ncbi:MULTISPECIES: hypothetical protein [unclassified Fusibacter]|uniref:hypothetical protein n=1 Tax=unclassified Fusibacter TaxID=2624464 RepID=UPI00101202A6|nr:MULTISPECIES: hypothetical protein [unclassified Fusibacter]MCK8060233.1 hypothetical protein [Fusibacter sp. A2]NPE22372.1 hypothetical protein [Fusibacter sp. A1]RXV61144.1 hypothetical protein DWB64_11040 [Fusibacter sp. A1]
MKTKKMAAIVLILALVQLVCLPAFADAWLSYEDISVEERQSGADFLGIFTASAVMDGEEPNGAIILQKALDLEIVRLNEPNFVEDNSYLIYDENGKSFEHMIPEYVAFLQTHRDKGLNPKEYIKAREKFIDIFTYPNWVPAGTQYLDENYEIKEVKESHYSSTLDTNSVKGIALLLLIWEDQNPDKIAKYMSGSDSGGFMTGVLGLIGISGAIVGLSVLRKKKTGSKRFEKKSKPVKEKKKKNDRNQTDDKDKTDDEEDENQAELKVKSRGVLIYKKNCTLTLTPFISNSNGKVWMFTVNQDKTLPQIPVTITSLSSEKARIELHSAKSHLSEGESRKEYTITIVAKCEGEVLEKAVIITVAREGMFVVSEEPKVVYGDKTTVTELKVTAVKEFDGRLITDYPVLENIKFELKTFDDVSRNVYSIAQIDFEVLPDWENVREAIDSQSSNDTFARVVFKLKTKEPITSRKKDKDQPVSYESELVIRSEVRGEKHERSVKLCLMPPMEPVRSLDLEEEYAFTKHIIETYVPNNNGYRDKFLKDLDTYKYVWGADLIYEYRHKIWSITQKLIEANGLEGYREMLNDIETYDEIRFWTQWVGDIALDGVLMIYMGVTPGAAFGQAAIGMMKKTVVSIINDIKDKFELYDRYTMENFTEWKDQQVYELLITSPDHLITATSIRGLLSAGKATAYMFGLVFFRSLMMNIDWDKWGEKWENDPYIKPGEVMVDLKKALLVAFKEVGMALTAMALSGLVSKALVTSAIKNNLPMHDSVRKQYVGLNPGNEPVKPKIKLSDEVYGQAATSILDASVIPRKVNKAYTISDLPDGMPAKKLMLEVESTGKVSFETMMENWSDNKQNSMRTLKDVDAKYQKAFMETYSKLKTKRKDFLVSEMKKMKNVPWEGKDIDVVSMSNSKFSQDDDFRVVYKDDRGAVLEVSARHWADQAKSWFKENTGYNADECQQVGMTRHGDEAFGGFATQKMHKGKDGVYRYVNVDPEILSVYAGNKKLNDGAGYGAVYWNKVNNSASAGEMIAQSGKFVVSFKKVLKSHKKQGFNVPEVDASLSLAMNIVERVSPNFEFTPDVEVKLNSLLKKETGYVNVKEVVRDMVQLAGRL